MENSFISLLKLTLRYRTTSDEAGQLVVHVLAGCDVTDLDTDL